jgi:hypothetical protein
VSVDIRVGLPTSFDEVPKHIKQVGAQVRADLGLNKPSQPGAGDQGDRVEIGRVVTYYKDPVTTVEATKVARWLADEELKNDPRDSKVAFQLLKDGRLYQLKAGLRKGLELDDKIKAQLGRTARRAGEVLGGATVEYHVCDDDFETKTIVFP